MDTLTETELFDELLKVTRKSIQLLFKSYPETFYYVSLVIFGSGNSPSLTAWSYEALESIALNSKAPNEEREMLKWSWADSPYSIYGERQFQKIWSLFEEKFPSLDSEDAPEDEFDQRLRIMENVMMTLDKEGLFGTGEARDKIFINAEYMPPEPGKLERALRLNPKEALKDWLIEQGPEYDE